MKITLLSDKTIGDDYDKKLRQKRPCIKFSCINRP